MLHSHQILVSTLALGICVATLCACGQQGSLYLPTVPAAAKPSSTTASAPTRSPETPPTPAPP
ncbi:MAG: LPS translocon maturation chaperone LptM [Rhodoferax sp.]